jgi:hypothetical protein
VGFEKIGKKNDRNTAGVKIRNTDKLVGLADKSAGFQKTGVAISSQFLLEPDRFLSKIGKWNEKIVKNNDMTSTKFVYINSS